MSLLRKSSLARLGFVCAVVLSLSVRVGAEGPSLPMRPVDSAQGSEFARRIADLDLNARERAVVAEVERGNLPRFWRRFVEVEVTDSADGSTNRARYWVAPDYLAIGSDEDYFLAPLSPMTAQAIADRLQCVLPTRKMVDDIYRGAAPKLVPQPIAPSAAMTTVPVFAQHNESIRQQRAETLAAHPLGALVAGHKKDLVLTPSLAEARGRVAIYGWHQAEGRPIQPLHTGHTVNWVDYSHGVRLVARSLEVNGTKTTIDAVLSDPVLAGLLSDEGPFKLPRYDAPAPPDPKPDSGEEMEEFAIEPGVRVLLNQPAGFAADPKKPVRLILYALPNGNSIAQTMGRRVKAGDDWHFDIQHIAAQTRWLRERFPQTHLVVAYLECEGRSWPAWRKKHDPDDRRVVGIVDELRRRFAGRKTALVLTGHSGGGSFTFGFLNGLQRIPDDVERIAFLDSNYAYNATQGHSDKLVRWLEGSEQHLLCVLAYHDSVALLNAKTFVSEQGGTWGRSLAMQKDLAEHFVFASEADADWRRFTAAGGRIKFLLKENPTQAVLHTRQVEWNGFIHAMLTGTPLEGQGYTYFGPRAYESWIGN